MSAGAVFKLIANDGKADRMIMATALLNQRIKEVMCARTRAGKDDPTPTLVDLERTHILYVNAHFKPFAAIGYEYNKVRPQSGNPTLGGGVTFSIPQFGDFFHDMVCRVRLSAFQGVAGLPPLQANGGPFPLDGGAQTAPFYNIVDPCGKQLVAGSRGVTPVQSQVQYQNFVHYCEYPGNRLFNRVKFDVNGNPLDEYDTMVPTMLEKFCTPPNKRIGHDRLVGQETPLTGYGGLCCATVTDADTLTSTTWNTPSNITKFTEGQSNSTVGLFNAGATLAGIAGTDVANVALNAVIPQIDISRKLNQIVNGPQTPKPEQAPLEIWNKLRFWFNDDVRLSIPSVSIPFGQRFITIDLAQQSVLTYEFPSIYLETITDDGANRRTYTYTPIFQRFGMTSVSILKMELYINNIFVNPEIHDIYIKRIGFSLIRVYRQQSQQTNQESGDEKLLSQLKWPVEYMFVGLRPTWNVKDITTTGTLVTGGNQNQWRDWHRLTRMVDAKCDEKDQAFTANTGAPLSAGTSVGKVIPDRYYLPVPSVNSMSLIAHGISIFDDFTDKFYNQYIPYHYGGPSLMTPDDVGALFVNMALFPRSYQPSGHLNVSRSRETYLKWTTSYISSKTPADLLVVAVALNFLLITDGSAVLRYST